jgi:hypothetical protein
MFDTLNINRAYILGALRRFRLAQFNPNLWIKFLLGAFVSVSGYSLLFLQPAATPYYTGFAALLIPLIFVVASGVGAAGPLKLVLILIVGMVYLEPQILITQTLPIRLIGDGMIVGAVVGWVLTRPSIPSAALIPASLIGTYSILHFAMPFAIGTNTWFGTYEALVIARYPILIALSAAAFRIDGNTRWLLVILATGSIVIGAAGVIETLKVGNFNHWMNDTYLAWRQLSPNEVDLVSSKLVRVRGLLGNPIDTGVLLAASAGVWIVALRNSNVLWMWISVLVVISIISFTVFGTGSRTAIGIAGVGVVIGVAWLLITRKQGGTIAVLISLFVVPILIMGASLGNTNVRNTMVTSVGRSIQIPASIIFADDQRDRGVGTPYESITKRFNEIASTPMTVLGTDPSSLQGRDAEYFDIILSYGIIAVIPYVAFWIIFAWRTGKAAFSTRRDGFAMVAHWIVVTAAVSAWGKGLLFDPSMMVMVAVVAGVVIGLDDGEPTKIPPSSDGA